MSSNRKFINTMFDIFGYSFVGVLAFLFGLVLQNYNSNGKFFEMIWSYSNNARHVILVIIVQLLLILLFGHAYAKSVLFGKADLGAEDGIDACAIVGHWLETIIVIVAVFLGVTQIIYPTFFDQYFWCTILFNSTSYILSFFAYRRLLVKKADSHEENKRLDALRTSSRYVLFCPAMLMIGFNILSGANICAMLDGSIICYVCSFIIFIGLLIIYTASSDSMKCIFVCGLLVVVGFGIASLVSWENRNNNIVLKNFFLASMVSVYLSIFESWYVVFRQKENSPDALYFRLTLGVVSVMPVVATMLFPIQNFNFIYFISSLVGMFITDYISFLVVFPVVNRVRKSGDKTKRNIAIARACCGIATLILLMLDKYIVFIPEWYDTDAELISKDVVSVLSLFVALISLVFPYIQYKLKKDKSEYFRDSNGRWQPARFMLLRFTLFFIAILFSDYIYGFVGGDLVKSKLSSIAILIYLFFSLFIFWKSSQSNVAVKEAKNGR